MSDIRIKASKCTNCDKVIVPPRDLCPYCRHKPSGFNIIELRNEGKVLSFTEVHRPPEGFEPPLNMALVELEFGAVVLCLAENDFDSSVEIDSKVILSLDNECRLRFRLA
jgi:uncharacterized OB-fold protein